MRFLVGAGATTVLATTAIQKKIEKQNRNHNQILSQAVKNKKIYITRTECKNKIQKKNNNITHGVRDTEKTTYGSNRLHWRCRQGRGRGNPPWGRQLLRFLMGGGATTGLAASTLLPLKEKLKKKITIAITIKFYHKQLKKKLHYSHRI